MTAGMTTEEAVHAWLIGGARGPLEQQEDVLDWIKGVLPGVAQGAATGAVAGPWGALAGGVLGGLLNAAQMAGQPQPSATAPPPAPPGPAASQSAAGSGIPPGLVQQLAQQLLPMLMQVLQPATAAPRREVAAEAIRPDVVGDAVPAWAFTGESAPSAPEDPGIEGPIPDDPSANRESAERGEEPAPSRFVAAAVTNYRRWTMRSRRPIGRIVIHITDGGPSINGPISWFQDPASGVSAHYIVGRDGEVVQMVADQDVAWHAHGANADSIGIEHVARTPGTLSRARPGMVGATWHDPGLPLTEAQYCASAALVRSLCERYGIPMDRAHIQGHSEADARTSHTGCPNPVWNWDHYMNLVTSATCVPLGAPAERPNEAVSAAAAPSAPSAEPRPAARARPPVAMSDFGDYPATWTEEAVIDPIGVSDVWESVWTHETA